VHRRGARLAAIAAHFPQGCHDQDNDVAPRSTARDLRQRAHFMDIALFRAGTPLGLPFDRANPLEVVLPVVAVIGRARFPESLVLFLLGLLSLPGLAAMPVSPFLGLPPAARAVPRSVPVLGPWRQSVFAPFEEARPSKGRFFRFGACLRIQSRVDKQ
jgi:hypothetical protein